MSLLRVAAPASSGAPSAAAPMSPPPSRPALARKPARVSPAAAAAVSRSAPSASRTRGEVSWSSGAWSARMKPVAVTVCVTCLRGLAGSSGSAPGACRRCGGSRRRGAPRPTRSTRPPASVLRRSRGPWPLYAATPVSSSAIAVAVNAFASVVVPLKSNAGLRDRGAAERLLQVVDVGQLVVADGRREREQLAGQRAAGDGLHVELGLQVLEQEREVQDRAVLARRRLAERERRQAADQQPSGGERAAADGRAAEQIRAGLPALLCASPRPGRATRA